MYMYMSHCWEAIIMESDESSVVVWILLI